MTFYPEQKEITEVSTDLPCLHCGKPDWCYRLGELLTACKRGADPASGWERTSKSDKEGTPYYAPAATKKAIRPKSRKEYFYPDRNGERLIKVIRIDNGEGKKDFRQYHWNGKRWISGVPEEIRNQITIYRYQQVRKAIASGRTVFMVEGEGCADALALIGICATTTLGGSGKYKSYGSYQEDLAGADLVLCPDRDEPGVKHMEAIASDFPDAQWLYAPPNDFYWQRLPKSQGLDVSDWLSSSATADDIRAAVTKQKFGLPSKPYVEVTNAKMLNAEILDEEPLTAPMADEVFTQKAIDALYSNNHWISIDSKLHQWAGTYFKVVSEASEKRRIAAWCNSTAVHSGGNRWSYAYAKNHIVDGIYNWLLVTSGVNAEEVNPPGLNCLNGVLNICWHGKQPTWELVPHNPEIIYTYVGEFEFDPNADPEACDRLLSCLEPEQREILIMTLAASLDLDTIRRFRSRIKALLCKGDGNNGKDSIREAVRLLYGVGVTGATFSDFSQYEQGRKFPLAKLDQARVNWSSENSSVTQLEKLQCLKAAITGEPLEMELKNATERPMNPRCVFLFNINDIPNIQASLDAIKSRYAVLSFNKTFVVGSDPSKGEIEADPRFRYDPDFLQCEVVPALLNKMLAALPEVATRAINYRCTEAALEDIQRDTNHLRAFCQDVGLDYQLGGKVYISELWKSLFQWYLDNGYAEIEIDTKGKEQADWSDPSRKSDKLVKADHQVRERFLELFPQAGWGRENGHHPTRAKHKFLTGIGFGEPYGNSSGEPYGNSSNNGISSMVTAGTLSPSSYLKSVGVETFLSNLEPQQLQEMWTKMYQRSSRSSHPYQEEVKEFPEGSPVEITGSGNNASFTNSSGSNAFVLGNAGTSVDNSTKNFPPASVSDLKEGDRVINVKSTKAAENWRGTIVKLRADGRYDVEWDERPNNKGKRRVYPHPKHDLRRVEN